MKRILLISLALAALTVVLYAPARGFDFINYDDPMFVSENRHVQQGVTVGTIRWALGDVAGWYWHPVASLSHLFVTQAFGRGAGGHHVANVLLHALNAVGVFLVLHLLTAATWRAAAVAALWACHPLNVEPVAWVTERSTLLCGLFSLSLIACYAWYARRPSVRRYLPLPALLVLAMAAKPTAMTLPLVLLLLDVWPLGRMQPQAPILRRLVIEKLPLLAVVLVLVGVMLRLHADKGAFRAEADLPPAARVARAVVHYGWYLGMTVWPRDLVMPYPPFPPPSATQVAGSAALLCGLTALVFMLRRRPYFAVGWLWFLVTLAPMVGLVQVRDTPIADRYTYFANLGLFVALVWGAADLVARARIARIIVTAVAAVTCVAFAVVTRAQLRHWRDSHSLFTHAITVYPVNPLAHNQLGEASSTAGRLDEALAEYRTAVAQKPDYPEALNNVGAALQARGDIDAALRHFDRALQLDPRSADVHNNIANALLSRGNVPLAVRHYREAVRLKPDSPTIRHNLASALAAAGDVREAIVHDEAALALRPDYADAHYTLGISLVMTGWTRDGLPHLLEAARLRPQWPEPLVRAAWVLATHANREIRDGRRAVALAERACALTHRTDATALDTLGAALAEAGRWDEAVAAAAEAERLARGKADEALATDVAARAAAYRSGRTVAMMRSPASRPATCGKTE